MQERLRHRKDFYWFEQCDMQLKLGLAAMHTTGTLLTHILFELAAGPEYLKPLREEVRLVLGEDLGALTKQGLTNLCHMDSSMKELQRLSPLYTIDCPLICIITISKHPLINPSQ